MKDNPKIKKYQIACCLIGVMLMMESLILSLHLGLVLIGVLVSLGSLGWFALSLMMSPQVRRDLLGSRFEAVQPETEN
jgi:hypothetical protein